MSAPLAGKFQDHYEVLGIDPRADSDTIQRAYTKLAKKFHPNNEDTGDLEKFEAVNLAYEVLSNPVLRPEFDKVKGLDDDKGPPKFHGVEFFDYMGREKGLRTALLCLLYDRRRKRPFTPSLTMRHIESMLVGTVEEFTFMIWYLKQRNLVQSDDKSSLQITVAGIDYLEENPPSPKLVMSFVKPGALAVPSAAPATAIAAQAQAPVAASVHEEKSNGVQSVLAALGRALARAEETVPLTNASN